MRRSIFIVLMICAGSVVAFGVPGAPDVPDVPDADIPDIEIPGLEILDGIQLQLEELIAVTDSLEWLIPELSALEEVSAKLEEIRETDPDVIGLQAEIDALRAELVDARSEIQTISDTINGEIGEVKASIDTFLDGLPIPE